MNEISINISIAGRKYPLTIAANEEQNIRALSKMINEKMLAYGKQFSLKDNQDALAMFAIEWSISPNNTWLGHFINLITYIFCGIILFKLLQKLLPQLHHFVIVGSVLLFIAHPIHTEVVGNIKSRDELLCFLF